jgi:hypothetical protein
MVSIVSSPPVAPWKLSVGLPNGLLLRVGESSMPLIDADLLFGVEEPNPWDETGDRMGDGDLCPEDREVRPAMCNGSRPLECSACSDCTTSANEMKLSRRTSALSSAP